MRRREFISLFVGVAAACSLVAHAQGNHQASSDGRSFEKAPLDGNAIKPYRVMPSDRENDHGEENEVEDQKDEEGEKGRSIAEEEALGGQEEHAEEVGRQEGEADAPQGRSPEV